MSAYFIDSSGIVKRYVPERGSAWLTSLFFPIGANTIYISAIASVEVVAALARRVRDGSLSASDLSGALAQLDQDLASDYSVIELAAEVTDRAKAIALKYGLRGYDSVQLASALETNTHRLKAGEGALTFISADSSLNGVANSEGLKVDDPNAHP